MVVAAIGEYLSDEPDWEHYRGYFKTPVNWLFFK